MQEEASGRERITGEAPRNDGGQISRLFSRWLACYRAPQSWATGAQPEGEPGPAVNEPTGVGSEQWWANVTAKGCPLFAPLTADRYEVLFLWRDPQGNARHSTTQTVYMDVNSVTDHHSPTPAMMQRWPGTDVWYWLMQVPADWRGAYQFIPCPAALCHDPLRAAREPGYQRQWWISLQALAVRDPLNPVRAQRSQWGARQSALQMPRAPAQPAWTSFDLGADTIPPTVVEMAWESPRLGNRRSVWRYQTGHAVQTTTGRSSAKAGQAEQPLPLVILLDGRFWAENMPVFDALEYETRSGRLPPALYLLIDEIDTETRSIELPCNPVFWEAVLQELLPQVAAEVPVTQLASRTVVAGQSFGGLAALYAGLHWPTRFGAVLSQSGSFWWPDRTLVHKVADPIYGRLPGAGGWLTDYARQHGLATPLKVWLEAGTREGEMISLSETMSEVLQAGPHQVACRAFEGGHDRLCWRGGLLAGLSWLLAD